MRSRILLNLMFLVPAASPRHWVAIAYLDGQRIVPADSFGSNLRFALLTIT